MLGFFHFTLQFAISVEEIADSEHCPPLESSQSQHFPGQKPLFHKLFSKEPEHFGLLFLSFTFHLSLNKALHQSPSPGNILCLFRWYGNRENSAHLARRSHCQKHLFPKSPCFYSIITLKLTYVNHEILKVDIIFQ